MAVERSEIFIAFAMLILVIVMWNAVGLAAPRIHALMEHLRLEWIRIRPQYALIDMALPAGNIPRALSREAMGSAV